MMAIDWGSIRACWETDERRGFTWLCREHGIRQTPQAVRKRAKREGWIKKEGADNIRQLKTKSNSSNRKRETAAVNVKIVAGQGEEGFGVEIDDPMAGQESVENEVLTDREKVFVAEYLKDFNAIRAARAAGYSGKNPNASRIMAKSHIQAAIRLAVDKRIIGLGVDGDQIMDFWSAVLTVDVNEFQQLRHVPCPFCWSSNGQPQITMHEYLSRREGHDKLRMKALAEGRDIGAYSPWTEFEFIDETRRPNSQCCVCHGIGIEKVFHSDTRDLSLAAKRVYAGVKALFGGGVNIETVSKDCASKCLAKALGLFRANDEEKDITVQVSAEELLKAYDDRMKIARERQEAVDRERGMT